MVKHQQALNDSGTVYFSMKQRFDHVDLRVEKLVKVARFYEALLPALGFTRRMEVEGWLQYESEDKELFFGVTESPRHVSNENRVAFKAESVKELARLAVVAKDAGAKNIEGPMLYVPGYHAVFFEDPCGNRFEVCYREYSR